MDIKINPDYEKMMPKLSPEEYDALKESIKREGMHYPIIVNRDGVILDGHHRYRICRELGIEPKVQVMDLGDPLLERKFIIEINILRRHMTPLQRIEMAKALIEIEKELARRRQEATQLAGRDKEGKPVFKDSVVQNFGQPKEDVEGRVLKIVAPKIGVSHETLRQGLYILEHAPPEEVEKVKSGERAISNLYKEVKRWKTVEALKEKAKELKAPEGLYDVIVIDPPWPYGTRYDPDGRRCACPYPEMSIDELKKLKIPASENCILWLWTTNAFMHDAYHLLEAWGFEPKTILTWVKDRLGLGDWLRGQTEHCILAVKGKPKVNLTNQSTVLYGKAREHSRKPEEFYRLVDSLCFGRKLDYFGREKREGWDVYGTCELEEPPTASDRPSETGGED